MSLPGGVGQGQALPLQVPLLDSRTLFLLRLRTLSSVMQARSSGVEHYLDTVGVSGSNPLEPINRFSVSSSTSAPEVLSLHAEEEKIEQ